MSDPEYLAGREIETKARAVAAAAADRAYRRWRDRTEGRAVEEAPRSPVFTDLEEEMAAIRAKYDL